MKKLSLFLSRKTVLTIYKSFHKSNLDYINTIYLTLHESFKTKTEVIQYREALIITGEIKGTLRDRLYQDN